MDILIFYQYFGTPKGGWSTRVYEMCKRWVADGHEVTVITSPYDKSDLPLGKGFISNYNFEGIKVISINLLQSNKHSKLRRIYTFCIFSLISIYYSLKLKYDIIIASSGPITIGVPGLLAVIFRKKKLVFEVRDLWPEGAVQLGVITNKWFQALAYSFESLCYRMSSLVVACSDGMRDSIINRHENINTIVIPNACDVELFQSPTNFVLPIWAEKKKIFVYTGSLGLMDNCIQIIRAAEELQKRDNSDVHIVMIGEGAERKMLESESHRLQLKNIRFLGLIPKTEVIGWLHHSIAAFVVFKDLEVLHTSSPNKMFDAFAAGVPVIQSTQGWIKKTLETHNAGITVLPNDAKGFADAIEWLAANPVLRNEMAANCLTLALNHFNRNALAGKYIERLALLIK